MTCIHLQQLYQICQANELKISSSDVIRVTCHQCQKVETCPSTLTDEYEARESMSNLPKPDSGVEVDR